MLRKIWKIDYSIIAEICNWIVTFCMFNFKIVYLAQFKTELVGQQGGLYAPPQTPAYGVGTKHLGIRRVKFNMKLSRVILGKVLVNCS